jgi:hypothetical protein
VHLPGSVPQEQQVNRPREGKTLNPEQHGMAPNRELDEEKSVTPRAGGSLNLIRRPVKLPKMKPVKS